MANKMDQTRIDVYRYNGIIMYFKIPYLRVFYLQNKSKITGFD